MGAGGIIIIRRNIANALQVGITPSGRYKLWHALAGSHGIVGLLGWWLG